MPITSLGERMRELRIAAGWTQTDVAKKIGVSTSAVGMYEQGRREPSAAIMVDIAQKFGTSVDDLLNVQRNTSSELFPENCQNNTSTDLNRAIEQLAGYSHLTRNGKLLSFEERKKILTAFKAVAAVI